MLKQNNSVLGSNLPDPRQNEVLANLLRAGSQGWESHLEPCEMTPGQVLYESGSQLEYLYFPITALVSLSHVTMSGSPAEIAAVGNQGIVGIGLLLGGAIVTPNQAVVRSGGIGFRMRAQVIRDEINGATPVMNVMLLHMQALIRQMVQNVGGPPPVR